MKEAEKIKRANKLRASRASKFGKFGEQLACNHLVGLGYNIIERNYYCIYGELDIIAIRNVVDGTELVFCEVKARKTFSNYFHVIGPTKIKKICKSALHFMSQNYEAGKDYSGHFMRFDLIHIVGKQIHEHLENAWECNEGGW